MVKETWKSITLDQIGTFQKGSGISRAESNSGILPAVRYGEIYTIHDNYIQKYNSHISREVADKALRVHYGDILFACSGETKEDIAKCVAIIDDAEVYAGGDIIVLTPKLKVNPVFLGFVLNTPEVIRQKSQRAQGDAIVHISTESLKTIEILLPEYQEQCRIAATLSDIDALISNLEKLIAKKSAIKQGAMQELLTGKRRLPGFDGEWITMKVDNIVVRFATGLNPRQNFKLNTGGTNYYVTIKDFRDGVLYLGENCDRIDDAALSRINERSDLRKDDLLFSSIGRIGDAYLIVETPTNWNINESVFALRPNSRIISPLMLFWLLTSENVRRRLIESTTGSTLKSIKLGDLKEIECRFPKDIEEQNAIATILYDMDNEIKESLKKLAKYRLIKQGVMNELLTGRIRLVDKEDK